jgi:hypothetical protein
MFFIIGFVVSKTPNAPSFATPKSAPVQEIQTPNTEEKSAVVKTVAPSVTKTETPKPAILAEYKSALNRNEPAHIKEILTFLNNFMGQNVQKNVKK